MLGYVDIATEVSMLLSRNAYPREGNFVDDLNIISYLKGKHNSCLDLDPTYPEIIYENFETEKDWTAFYGDVKEAIPTNDPTPLGNIVDLYIVFNRNHAGYNTTRRSHTGSMIFVNMDLITRI